MGLVDPNGQIAWIPIILIGLAVMDAIDAANDVKDIIKEPGDPQPWIGLGMGIVDPTPGNIGKRHYRWGRKIKRLKKMQEAVDKSKGMPDVIPEPGLSVNTRPKANGDHTSADMADVEKVFPVTKTGKDPGHYTVEIGDPVTKEAMDAFNDLFK